jgi:hypothetical protein
VHKVKPAPEHWDAQKKPLPPQQALYMGPGFIVTPEPGRLASKEFLLPMPPFMARRSGRYNVDCGVRPCRDGA